MILVDLIRIQFSLILGNYKRVIECQLVWKLVLKHSQPCTFETNLTEKYTQSFQTVKAINTSGVLLIN